MTTELLIMAGDFDIHVNVKSNNDAVRLLDLLASMGLQQYVDLPTHISGNTLDLLITTTLDSSLLQDVQPNTYFSDHCSVLFSIYALKPHLSRKQYLLGKLRLLIQLQLKSW